MTSRRDRTSEFKAGWSDKIGELRFAHHNSRAGDSAPTIHALWNPAIDGMAQILVSGAPDSLHFPPAAGKEFDLKKLGLLLTRLKKESVERLLFSDPGGFLHDGQAFTLAHKLGFASSWLRLRAGGGNIQEALKLLESNELERLIITLEGHEPLDFKIKNELRDRVALQFFAADENWGERALKLSEMCGAKLFLISYPYLARPGVDAPEPETLLKRAIELEDNPPQGVELALFEMPFCAVSGGEPPMLTTLRIPPFVDLNNVYLTDDGSLLRRNFEWPGRRQAECKCSYFGSCSGLAADDSEKVPRRGIFPFLQRLEWTDIGSQGFVRPVLHCNQKCRFCWVEHGYRMPPLEHIARELERMDIKRLMISGGEPTLYPNLAELIAIATEKGMDVELQSNAMLLADGAYTDSLIKAGLKRAFISFHSHIEGKYEFITGIQGAYVRALAGLHRLLDSGLPVNLSHVIHRSNLADLPQYVRFIKREFSEHTDRISIIFSFVMDSAAIPDADLLPRFSEARPYLLEALEWCLENHLRFDGLHTPCGVPYCILDGDMRYYPTIDKAYHSGAHTYTEQCAACRLKPNCFGPRFLYVDRFGSDEFRAVR